MQASLASPPTMARAGMASVGVNLPSISASDGGGSSAASARYIASSVAWWMLSASISSGVAAAALQATACAVMAV